MEDMEESKSQISSPQLKDLKRDASSLRSSYKQKKYSCFKQEAASSTSLLHGNQQLEDVEQFKVETPDLKPEAQRDVPNQVGSVVSLTNRTHEVSHSVSGASMATSSIQQPHFQLQLGNPRPHTWLGGMASASSLTPVQLPVEQSSHGQQSSFIRSFQPYTPQPKEMMYYGQGLNFPSPIDHQLGSQFANFNGFPPLHVQNDIGKSKPRVAVKITHPETKEEVKLDEIAKGRRDDGSSNTRTHLNAQLQSHPVICDHYNLMNCFPYMQLDPLSLQNPTALAFSRTEMFPTSTQLSHNYLDIHGGVFSSNSIHVSSEPIPFMSEFGDTGEKVSSPVTVKSVVNDTNEAVTSRRPSRVGSNQGKSRIQPEIVIKPPPKAVTKPAISVVSSLRAKSSAGSADQGVVARKAVTDVKKTLASGHSDSIKKEYLGIQYRMEVHQHQQLKTSCFSDDLKSEVGEESPNEISTPLNDPKQSDCVSESPLILERSSSVSAKLDSINSPASSSSAELYASPLLKIQPHGGVDGLRKLEDTNYLTHISRKIESHYNLRNAAVDSIGLAGKKRYSRNFLLTFSSQFVELPTDFKLTDDMEKGLILGTEALHDHLHKIQDGSNWNKTVISASILGEQFGMVGEKFRIPSIRGGTSLRNLHEKISYHSDGSFGSLPHSTFHRGRKSKCPDADRGLISLPYSSRQLMHKAERKYEVCRVIDDEESKQRRLKAILNKLTPQNFERLFQQVKEVNIDNKTTLSGIISQIFDKALMEPTFCEMYANFCWHLASVLPNFVDGHQKITFKRLLLNKCQEEFVRGEREEAEASRIEEDGETELSKQKREEKRIRTRRRMFGNIRLIGELYKKRMLTARVLHGCIHKLIGDYHNPDEEDIEALCKLMSTVGEIIDHSGAKDQIDSYFETMESLAKNAQLPSRIRFMLKDVIDLRNNKWKQRRKVEGPKKIEELHSDAAQERRALMNQLPVSPSFTSSNLGRFPAKFDPKSSAFQSPQNSRPGVVHAVTTRIHGFASQDAGLQGKHHRQGTPPVSFPHWSSDGKKIQ